MLWSIGKSGDVFGAGLGDDEDVMPSVAALCRHRETGRKSNAIAVALVRAYERGETPDGETPYET
jgi:hypothetical protein